MLYSTVSMFQVNMVKLSKLKSPPVKQGKLSWTKHKLNKISCISQFFICKGKHCGTKS